jgi:hypothetical protein
MQQTLLQTRLKKRWEDAFSGAALATGKEPSTLEHDLRALVASCQEQLSVSEGLVIPGEEAQERYQWRGRCYAYRWLVKAWSHQRTVSVGELRQLAYHQEITLVKEDALPPFSQWFLEGKNEVMQDALAAALMLLQHHQCWEELRNLALFAQAAAQVGEGSEQESDSSDWQHYRHREIVTKRIFDESLKQLVGDLADILQTEAQAMRWAWDCSRQILACVAAAEPLELLAGSDRRVAILQLVHAYYTPASSLLKAVERTQEVLESVLLQFPGDEELLTLQQWLASSASRLREMALGKGARKKRARQMERESLPLTFGPTLQPVQELRRKNTFWFRQVQEEYEIIETSLASLWEFDHLTGISMQTPYIFVRFQEAALSDLTIIDQVADVQEARQRLATITQEYPTFFLPKGCMAFEPDIHRYQVRFHRGVLREWVLEWGLYWPILDYLLTLIEEPNWSQAHKQTAALFLTELETRFPLQPLELFHLAQQYRGAYEKTYRRTGWSEPILPDREGSQLPATGV